MIILKNLIRIARNMLHPKRIRYYFPAILLVIRTEGIGGILVRLRRGDKPVIPIDSYAAWIASSDTLNNQDRSEIKTHIGSFLMTPKISIIMPVYNVDVNWLSQAIDSVITQLYENWELCIADDASTNPEIRPLLNKYAAKDSRIKICFREKNGHISEASNSALAIANGEYVALLDHDDMLSEHALYHVVNAINIHPEADMFYSDEDIIGADGVRRSPYFKPDWNPDLLFSQNYFCHLGVYRKSIIDKIGGFRRGLEGSQDYDICLRAYAQSNDSNIVHIPHILYHWRAIAGSTALSIGFKNYALDAARRALQDYFDNNYPGVIVEDAIYEGYHHAIWPVPQPHPTVSMIIPTKDKIELLRSCINSITNLTEYDNYEIVVVNNNSELPETFAYFDKIKKQPNIRVLDYPHPFNFSAINNFAVNYCSNDLIAFINNDIEVITPGWLKEMVGHAIRPDVGIVGAKLLYSDMTIQHGGVKLGTGDGIHPPVAGHLYHRAERNHAGHYARLQLVQSISAVTGACMVMRKSVFTEVGGFNEANLAVAFNDVDLCLKVTQKGYRIIYTPHAELFHHESQSRCKEDENTAKMKRFHGETKYMREMWASVLDNDPYYNPNLNHLHGDYSLGDPDAVPKPWKLKNKKKAA